MRLDKNGTPLQNATRYFAKWPDGDILTVLCECDEEDGDALLLRGNPDNYIEADSTMFDDAVFSLCETPAMVPPERDEIGRIKHQKMLKVDGKSFRCECSCNVFHNPDQNQPELYECNGCGNLFRGEKE